MCVSVRVRCVVNLNIVNIILNAFTFSPFLPENML